MYPEVLHFHIYYAKTGVFISGPYIYFRGSFGQSIKLAKKPRTIILRILVTIEKLSFSVQLSNIIKSFNFKFKLCTILNIEKCCPPPPSFEFSPKHDLRHLRGRNF
jgi:hypothetical protein